MSDLSRLLGDVYGPEPETPAPDEKTDADEAKVAEAAPATTLSGALPAWADETVLDEAFANWVPGPPTDAPEAERDMLSDLATRPTGEVAPVSPEARATTLAEAVPGGRDFVFPSDDHDVAAPLATAAAPRWQRNDDDLLPLRARSRGWRRK